MIRAIPLDVASAAQSTMSRFRVPASVTIAQWIVESGWGAHMPGNNPFGMKPRKGMNDPSQMLMTTEEVNGKDIKIKQPFRVFPSLAAAFDAHALLLSTAPIYAPAMAMLPLNTCPSEAAIGHFIDLMAPHYASDSSYAAKVKAEIADQQLQRFDTQ